MIIQGSNVPLTIKFDAAVDGYDELIVTLWGQSAVAPLKTWHKTDMTVSQDTAVCPISEIETKALPPGTLTVEAKGLNGGETVFWAAYETDVLMRRDRIITMTQAG